MLPLLVAAKLDCSSMSCSAHSKSCSVYKQPQGLSSSARAKLIRLRKATENKACTVNLSLRQLDKRIQSEVELTQGPT